MTEKDSRTENLVISAAASIEALKKASLTGKNRLLARSDSPGVLEAPPVPQKPVYPKNTESTVPPVDQLKRIMADDHKANRRGDAALPVTSSPGSLTPSVAETASQEARPQSQRQEGADKVSKSGSKVVVPPSATERVLATDLLAQFHEYELRPRARPIGLSVSNEAYSRLHLFCTENNVSIRRFLTFILDLLLPKPTRSTATLAAYDGEVVFARQLVIPKWLGSAKTKGSGNTYVSYLSDPYIERRFAELRDAGGFTKNTIVEELILHVLPAQAAFCVRPRRRCIPRPA